MGKVIGIILLAVVIVIFSFFHGLNQPASNQDEPVNFLIEPGQGMKEISENLFEENLIDSKFYFLFYVWTKGWEKKLQAGEYVLNKNMNIKEIGRMLSGGEGVDEEVIITVIEGWNTREIGQYLESKGMFQSEELLELAGFPGIYYGTAKDMPRPKDFSSDYNFLADKPKLYGLEGYLFPDTYRVYEDVTLEDIVRKMLNNFDKKLTLEMRTEIKKQGWTIYEIITLAAIIEKEVGRPEDMKMISDIFHKRLQTGIALQSDATINFITKKGVTRPSTEDLAVEHPYNTYKHRGLPPGPIANPGLAAIEAAIYPTANDYYYFLTTPEGEVIYSYNYEGHLEEKNRYYK